MSDEELFDATPESPSGSETSRARKSIIYELFILGELMDEAHHGYQLREILCNLLGPFRQISWGVLYPLIRQLEREELLVSDTEVSLKESEHATANGTSRQRKQYHITEVGRKRFYLLMLERGDYSTEYRELFTIKLNNFDHLSLEQQFVILQQYREYLQVEDLYLSEAKQSVFTDAGIPEKQRAHILRIIDFRWSTVQGEIRWIEHYIEHLEEGSQEIR